MDQFEDPSHCLEWTKNSGVSMQRVYFCKCIVLIQNATIT